MNLIQAKKKCTALLLIFAFTLLSACASTSGPRRASQTYTAAQYLQLASSTTGNAKQGYLLQAANRLIDEKQTRHAQSVLNQISSDLPPHLRLKKQLTSAKLLMAYNENDNALSALQAMNGDRSAWTQQDRVEWHTLAAKANENLGNINASIQQRTELITLLPSNERKRALMSIWNTLENINATRIRNLLSDAKTPTIKGWLSLAAITDQSNVTPQQLSSLLARWKSEYAKHPAAALLPSDINQLKHIPPNHPSHIALLLPLTGNYAKAGNAIRNGFLAAYYNAKQQNQPTPEITIIDTNGKKIAAAYQEAINKGANFVVGPLVKSNITKLVENTRISVPTLALNTVPGLRNANLYQFGLSPIDEAQQAAMKAWSAHRRNALVIAPKNKWGKSVAEAFIKTWQSLGGQVVDTLAYTNQKNLTVEVRHLLNIDQATSNQKALKKVLRERLRFIPRRRKDSDVIFLVATSTTARQIRPMLRYFYAGDLPVYSTSNIYTGQPNAHRDHDLNGIRFPDMPWVLSARMKSDALNQVRQHARAAWPQSFAVKPKLIALGVDAYDIIPKLNKMAMLPDLGTSAATGTLYLSNNQHIYRKLRWSKIRNGLPHHIQ